MRRREELSLATMFGDLRADFRAGKDTRFTSRLAGTLASGSGADWHYRVEHQYWHMLERARHYQRNDPIVGQGVRRLVANVIQDGFNLDPTTGDDALDADLKARWKDWSEDADRCHSEGEMCFTDIEQTAFSSIVVDGDVICLTLADGSLEMVEAHRLRTPSGTKRNVVLGVLLDERARRVEYWLSKQDLQPAQQIRLVSQVERYEARDAAGQRQVLHLYFPERFSQRRGITCLAPASDTIGMHDDVQFATLVKAQQAALVGIFHERGPNWEPSGGDQPKGDRTTESLPGGTTRQIEGVGAGLEMFGDKDEKLSMDSAKIPCAEYFSHAHLILTFIAINLDLPVAVLLLDPSNTNFSGWRGAIDQARLRFRQLQGKLIRKFHAPVYRWKVRQWASADPIIAAAVQRSGINLFAHRWNPPAFRYIQPLEDSGADLLQQRNMLNSARRLQAARGQDWDDVSTEIVDDNGMGIEKAIIKSRYLNEKYPEAKVHWREVISMPTPDGVQISLKGNDTSSGQQDPPAGSKKPASGDPAARFATNGHAH